MQNERNENSAQGNAVGMRRSTSPHRVITMAALFVSTSLFTLHTATLDDIWSSSTRISTKNMAPRAAPCPRPRVILSLRVTQHGLLGGVPPHPHACPHRHNPGASWWYVSCHPHITCTPCTSQHNNPPTVHHEAASPLISQLAHMFPHDEVAVYECTLALTNMACRACAGGTPAVTAPTALQRAVSTLCAEMFAPVDWQCLIDHVIVNGPYFLALAAAAATTVVSSGQAIVGGDKVDKVLALAYAAYTSTATHSSTHRGVFPHTRSSSLPPWR